MKRVLVFLSILVSFITVCEAGNPIYTMYTQDGALPIYITTNGIGGGTIPFYSMTTHSNALPVIITGIEGTIVDGSISNYVLKAGDKMTGGLAIDTNVTDKIMFLAPSVRYTYTTNALDITSNDYLTVTTSDFGIMPSTLYGNYGKATGTYNSATLWTNSGWCVYYSTGSVWRMQYSSTSNVVEGVAVTNLLENAVNSPTGTYTGYVSGAWSGYTGIVSFVYATNTPFSVVTNAIPTIMTNVVRYTTSGLSIEYGGSLGSLYINPGIISNSVGGVFYDYTGTTNKMKLDGIY